MLLRQQKIQLRSPPRDTYSKVLTETVSLAKAGYLYFDQQGMDGKIGDLCMLLSQTQHVWSSGNTRTMLRASPNSQIQGHA